MVFASRTTRGFYVPEIHGENMPADAVEIPGLLYAELISGQSRGKVIDWSGEMPALIEPLPLSLDELKVARCLVVKEWAEVELAMLSGAYPSGEVNTWPQQTREANALADDSAAPAPLLSEISRARGVGLLELAARVRAKVQAYSVVSGRIIGQRQALEDAINAVDLSAPDAREKLEAIKCPVSV